MTSPLTTHAQSVQDVLSNNNLTCEVVELSASTRTAQEAAEAIGCQVGQIAKSLIFKTKESGITVLVLASGSNRVNEKTIEKHVGEKIEKADAAFTKTVTGFTIGGIPPVGHKQKIENIYIDEDLLSYPELWAAAGMPNAVFSLSCKDLVTLTSGMIISVD